MKKNYWLRFFHAASIRTIKTMAQTAVSMIAVGAALQDIDFITLGSVTIVSGLLSYLTSLATGLPEMELPEYPDDGENDAGK